MAIYRGTGGSGTASDIAAVSTITQKAADAADSASAAASSALAAETAKEAAEAAQTAAEAAQESIDGLYLGALASDPTVDLNGNPVTQGDWYFNTTDNRVRIYNGSTWDTAITGQLTDDLATNGNNINFDDGDKAQFGDSADFQIYHDNALSHTYLKELGAGSLIVQAQDLIVNNAANTQNMIYASDGGAVSLYHAGNLTVQTNATGVGVTGNITVSGTVDGRDVATDGTKLDGIESGATADQSASEIKTAYESNANTNAFTDAEQTKLSGIETGATADQTKADIDALNIDADTLDGQHGSYYTDYTDTAISNLVDTAPATLDTLNELAAALGDDPNFATTVSTNIGTKVSKSGDTMTGNLTLNGGNIVMTGSETVDGRDVSVDGAKLDGIEAGATADQTAGEIKTAYESNADTNAFTDAEQTKLSGIEANADVTDTANVTAAGALMDSEVTNLAQVKAFNSADYATAAQGTTADSAMQDLVDDTTPQLGGNLDLNSNDITGTGNIDITGTAATDGVTVDGVDTRAHAMVMANLFG